MAHDQGGAGEIVQRLLEGAHRVHVEVVGRLVEEQDVRAVLHHQRHVEPVALTAGQHAHLLGLVVAGEVEPGAVRPGVDFTLAQLDDVEAAGKLLEHGFVRIQAGAHLVGVGELDRVAQAQGPGIWFFLAGDHAQQGGLPRAIGPDEAHHRPRRHLEGKVLVQELAVVALGQALRLNDHVAQPRPRREDDPAFAHLLLAIIREEFFVAFYARLRFGVPPLRAQRYPFQLPLQGLGPGGISLLLDL